MIEAKDKNLAALGFYEEYLASLGQAAAPGEF